MRGRTNIKGICNFTGKLEFLNLYNTGFRNYPANFTYLRGKLGSYMYR